MITVTAREEEEGGPIRGTGTTISLERGSGKGLVIIKDVLIDF